MRDVNKGSVSILLVTLIALPFLLNFASISKYSSQNQKDITDQEGTKRNKYQSVTNYRGIDEVPPLSITKIRLLGERNSGTNYIESVLSAALETRYASTKNNLSPFSGGDPNFLSFKHMFRQSDLTPSELQVLIDDYRHVLWIMAVRNPCDWADGMYRKPWHMCPSIDPSECPDTYIGLNRTHLEHVSREEFFTLPWNDWKEKEYKQESFSYSNVFALRRRKLHFMTQVMSVAPDRVKIVHFKSVEKAPRLFSDNLATEFNLTISAEYLKNQMEQTTHLHKSTCLTSGEWEIAQKHIDWELEATFGFNRLDCHKCSLPSNKFNNF